jgi:hypothetical protein
MNPSAGSGLIANQLAKFDPYSGCMGFSADLVANILADAMAGFESKCIQYMPDTAFSKISKEQFQQVQNHSCQGKFQLCTK